MIITGIYHCDEEFSALAEDERGSCYDIVLSHRDITGKKYHDHLSPHLSSAQVGDSYATTVVVDKSWSYWC